MTCAICGRRGNGVYQWGVVMPQGTVAKVELCSQHAEPLKKLVGKSVRERRRIGVDGLDELVERD